jgi:signal transduction histidine kinase
MKRTLFVFTCIALLSVFCVCFSIAQEKATKEECMAKCKEVAALIKEAGVDAAVAKVQDAKGPYVWKDTYVFVMDMDGKILAHPATPNLVGKTLSGLKDVNGKMFVNEYLAIATTAGEGWVDYMWPKPNEKTPSKKLTYVYKVPGQQFMVCAGIYE